MTNKEKAALISDYLDEILPDAGCELEYSKPYELVIAVMLSAQTTDKSVNRVTRILFSRFPTLQDLAAADPKEVYDCIKTIGLAGNKSRNVVGIAKGLIEKFGGEVPDDFEGLQTLPGVGRKTANVITAEIFHRPCIAVDTHVERTAKRLGLAYDKDTPYEVEVKLEKLFPEERQIKTHHQMIHFGRYHCFARNPECEGCHLQGICRYYKKNFKDK